MRPLAPLALLALAACAAGPPPPPVQPEPPAPPPEPEPTAALTPCGALERPLDDLRRLASLVSLGRSMPIRPLDPERFAAQLDADAKRARAIKSDDADLAKLVAEASSRLEKIAAAARTGSREPARAALLDEMERGELSVQLGEVKCPGAQGPAGRMSAMAIQRVVRGAFGEFKKCYEPALKRDPTLRGIVRVRFTVARDGAVSEAADADGGAPDPLAFGLGPGAPPIGDPAVRGCVVAAFRRLVFPKPQPASVGRTAGEARATEGGTFSSTYPIELDSTR